MGSIVWIPVAFLSGTLLLYFLSMNLPPLTDPTYPYDSSALKFPSTFEELTALAEFLAQYKKDHWLYILLLFGTAYVYKQTFAIPGSVFLNCLAGAIFGAWWGFPMVCVLSAVGATNCYLLSKYFGKDYVIRFFPDKIGVVQQKVEENMDSLFFFLLFLRMFPVSPNWFMNVVAPLLNIPVHMFFMSVLIGLMPYNFICVQTGCILSQLNSLDDIFTMWTFAKLIFFANVALLPGLLLKKYQEERAKSRTQHLD